MVCGWEECYVNGLDSVHFGRSHINALVNVAKRTLTDQNATDVAFAYSFDLPNIT